MFVKGLRQEDYCESELELHSESRVHKKKNLNFFFIVIFLSLFKCEWTLCLHVRLCTKHVSSGCEGQKRALDVLDWSFIQLKATMGCWDSNMDPLKEQTVL